MSADIKNREITNPPEFPQRQTETTSRQNTNRLLAQFLTESVTKGYYPNQEAAMLALQHEVEQIQNQIRFSINLSAASLSRFLELNNQETFWDHLSSTGGDLNQLKKGATTQGKNFHDEYIRYRQVAEESLRKSLATNPLTEHPLYAAVVASDSARKQGAGPNYGHFFLELDPKKFTFVTFCFQDSFKHVKKNGDSYSFDQSSLLSQEHVVIIQAMINLIDQAAATQNALVVGGNLITSEQREKLIIIDGNPSAYIEAVIFEPISPDQCDSLGAWIINQKDLADFGQLIREHPQSLKRFRITVSPGVLPPFTQKWLRDRCGENMNVVDRAPDEDTVLPFLSEGIPFIEAKNSIQQKRTELWDKIKKETFQNFFGQPRFENIRSVSSKAWQFPKLKTLFDEYIAVEKEAVFFSN